jgi:hypothetical protein
MGTVFGKLEYAYSKYYSQTEHLAGKWNYCGL